MCAQTYRPNPPKTLWDTWLFPDQEEYHLFFLQSDADDVWNSIGHAVSSDLVHWEPLPDIPTQGPAGTWDHQPTLTGCTVKRDNDYLMFYGANSEEFGQAIGIMLSDDLVDWRKHPDNPILVSQGPHYGGLDWRDMFACFDEDEERWHGYVCAQTDRGVSCVAHVVSDDLVEWEHLPPVYDSEDFVEMEVPDYFELRGQHYLLFSSVRSRKDTSGRRNASGTFYATAEHRDGPYELAEAPLLLGSGLGRFDNYVGRTIGYGNTRLLYHLTVGGPVAWGTPKLVRQEPGGELSLQYWDGLERLVTRSLLDSTDVEDTDLNCDGGKWCRDGSAIRGQSLWYGNRVEQPAACWLPASSADFMVTVSCVASRGARAGVACRWDGQAGVCVSLSPDNRAAALEMLHAGSEGLTADLVDQVSGVELAEGEQRLRVLSRGHRVEAYLNDRWLFAVSAEGMPSAGRLGLFIKGGSARFDRIRAAQLEPMD